MNVFFLFNAKQIKVTQNCFEREFISDVSIGSAKRNESSREFCCAPIVVELFDFFTEVD